MNPLTLVSAIHGLFVRGGRVQRLTEAVAELCPAGRQDILDIGCGDGQIAAGLARTLGADCRISGIDVMLRESAEIEVAEYDGKTVPFDDNSFDIVLLIDVLHHTEDPASLLKEAARVTRGCVIVKDHLCESRTDKRLLSFMDWVGNRPSGVRLEYNYLSGSEWDACIAEAGLAREFFTTDVKLYRWPLSMIFHRRMHVLMKLTADGD